MKTYGSIANLQRMPTEINESTATAKARILVESDILKYLETFRISFSQISILRLIIY